MKRVFILAFSLFFVAGSQLFAQESHQYIGAEKCKTCHKKEKAGKQYLIWKDGPHANAMKTLSSPEAMKIAKEKGIADPAKDPSCLKCHSTYASLKPEQLHAKGKLKLEEGVSCESCHGAGADYKKKKIMKDQKTAIANGLILPEEKVCKSCHNDESPTFKSFDFKKAVKEISHPTPAK
ncbi:MAG: cytochrome C554 [Calditrichaeota bacterium]|nr:MAG: cytochrome C554 [Calditrichota bacterium]MBL1206242.1 cytochrome C554 [Calditrichota bacterium]NOG46068.1 cytochrome C554 [Calditrichota bacterium]